MLKQIGSNVELIRKGPFRAARAHLDQAAMRTAEAADYDHLRQAGDLLALALGQCATPQESSVIQFNLGAVEAIRGNHAEARYRLRQAHGEGVNVTRELTTEAVAWKQKYKRAGSTHGEQGPGGVRRGASRPGAHVPGGGQ
jgi:hypothetical protein